MNEITFIDELLAEVEAKEESNSLAYFDMLVLQSKALETKKNEITQQAQLEVSVITEWRDKKTAEIDRQIEYLKSRLKAYLTELNVKTLELPHGILKFRKNPDRVTITDMEIFMKNAMPETVTVIPEQVRPDLTKIKAHIKSTGEIPSGVELITGENNFTITYHNGGQNG